MSDGASGMWSREWWRNYFGDVLVSGGQDEVEAAVAAAVAAVRQGRDEATAKAEGRGAAKNFRAYRAGVRPAAMRTAGWPDQLAPRLFSPPTRWGWQTTVRGPVATPPATMEPPPPRPVWAEPPPPDSSALRAVRSSAVSKLVLRVALTVVVAFAFLTYQLTIEQYVGLLGSSASDVYRIVVLVAAVALTVGLVRAIHGVRRATRDIRRFEQPYHALRVAERQRHQHALADWDEAVRRHAAESAAASRETTGLAEGPLWQPVTPAGEPTRVDVCGGDPRRHGWASLLVTLGTSVLTSGHRVTVLDFTGRETGDGLVAVTSAAGMTARRVELDDGGSRVDLLSGLAPSDIAQCLAYAVTGREDGRREERALATDVLQRVVIALDGATTFGRLAAGVDVLRQGVGDERLASVEIDRLVTEHLGGIGQDEWTVRQLRFLASQLEVLGKLAPVTTDAEPLWTDVPVLSIATEGSPGDRKNLVDRLLVQSVQRMMYAGKVRGFLVVAGGDHLGAETLRVLSEEARQAGVRLVLMIDQPQGELETTLGTGGAVCIMKMYNHRDANVAAELIGKGHRFVVNQVTRQVGKTFNEGGSTGFNAQTGQSSNRESRGRNGGSVGDNRGHVWTSASNWQVNDNIGTSTSSQRVYEFVVEPEQILGMPETAYVLVDNSGQGRRVVMVDANPGICLLDRVSQVASR